MVGLGNSTILIDRGKRKDEERDGRLLREIERQAGLVHGTLERTDVMNAREYRLIEGVDHDSADRIATTARRLGYQPVVLEHLGVQWTPSLRLEVLLAVPAGILSVPIALSIVQLLTGGLGTIFGVFVGLVSGLLVWWWARQRSYLPLVVSPHAIAEQIAEPVRVALVEADDALRDLAEHVARPDATRGDTTELKLMLRELRERLVLLRGEAARSFAVTESRLDAMRDRLHEAAEAGEVAAALDTLVATIEQEKPAQAKREVRVQNVAKELRQIRQLARDALRLGVADHELAERREDLLVAPGSGLGTRMWVGGGRGRLEEF
ncbi:MAG: hypothetical protein AAF602_18650, partial [Myxococcota bacterium]